MVEEIKTHDDYLSFVQERFLADRLRTAIGFCKDLLELDQNLDKNVKYEERVNMEKCLT